jgi:uncharacterized protein YidB (DUF937 family)
MSGLDDLLGSMTQGGGGGGGSAGGMGDLLGGLLGGGSGGGGGGGGLQDVLGGLLGGGGGGKGMNLGAMAVALAPMLGKFLKGGGLSQMMGNAQAAGLTDQADSWVSTGENKPIDGQQARAMVGDDAVKHLAQEAGISEDEAAEVLAKVVPGVVNGVTPNGQLPSDDELDNLVTKFGG